MITKPDLAKLTSASFAPTSANGVDMGVGRSVLLNNIRHGREVDHIMTELDPEYLPDQAVFRPQYEILEHGNVTSAINIWYWAYQDSYKVLAGPWSENPCSYAVMVKLIGNVANSSPVSDPAREGWEKGRKGHG